MLLKIRHFAKFFRWTVSLNQIRTNIYCPHFAAEGGKIDSRKELARRHSQVPDRRAGRLGLTACSAFY